jgi:hypothetical protein
MKAIVRLLIRSAVGQSKSDTLLFQCQVRYKRGRRFYLPSIKRWHLLPPFLSNEPGTGKFTNNQHRITERAEYCARICVGTSGLSNDTKKHTTKSRETISLIGSTVLIY